MPIDFCSGPKGIATWSFLPDANIGMLCFLERALSGLRLMFRVKKVSGGMAKRLGVWSLDLAVEEDGALLQEDGLQLADVFFQLPRADPAARAQGGSNACRLPGDHGLVQIPQIGRPIRRYTFSGCQQPVDLFGHQAAVRDVVGAADLGVDKVIIVLLAGVERVHARNMVCASLEAGASDHVVKALLVGDVFFFQYIIADDPRSFAQTQFGTDFCDIGVFETGDIVFEEAPGDHVLLPTSEKAVPYPSSCGAG